MNLSPHIRKRPTTWPAPGREGPARDARPTTHVTWADDAASLREAQALRHEVFALEKGARLHTPVPGLDIDEFDAFCDHVLVRDTATGQVLGTCRLLRPAGARRCGRGYADSEFDLRALQAWRPRMLEMGRTCIRRGHRGGAVLLGLWGAVAGLMQAQGLDMLLGCTSIPLADGGHTARGLLQALEAAQWVPPAQRARPRLPLPLPPAGQPATAGGAEAAQEGAALLQSYLRFGARVCAEPAWDRAFGVADILTLLDLRDLPRRHRRHFLQPGGLGALPGGDRGLS